MVVADKRFALLRRRLDEFGYGSPLGLESVQLVENLFSDLLHTTESLRASKGENLEVVQNLNNFNENITPLKRENAILTQENNRLHEELLKAREVANVREAKVEGQARKLRGELQDLTFLHSQTLHRMQRLEEQIDERDSRLRRLLKRNEAAKVYIAGAKGTASEDAKQEEEAALGYHTYSMEMSYKLDPASEEGSANFSSFGGRSYEDDSKRLREAVATATEAQAEQISALRAKVESLTDAGKTSQEELEFLRKQIKSRDEEIERRGKMLEGGRDVKVLYEESRRAAEKNPGVALGVQIDYLTENNDALNKELSEMQTNYKKLQKERASLQRSMTKVQDRNSVLMKELGNMERLLRSGMLTIGDKSEAAAAKRKSFKGRTGGPTSAPTSPAKKGGAKGSARKTKPMRDSTNNRLNQSLVEPETPARYGQPNPIAEENPTQFAHVLLQDTQKQLRELRITLKAREEELVLARAHYGTADAELRKINETLADRDKKLEETMVQLSVTTEHAQQARKDRDTFQGEIKVLKAEQEDARRQIGDLELQVLQLREQLNRHRGESEKLQEETEVLKEDTEMERETLRRHLRNTLTELSTVRHEKHEIQAKLETATGHLGAAESREGEYLNTQAKLKQLEADKTALQAKLYEATEKVAQLERISVAAAYGASPERTAGDSGYTMSQVKKELNTALADLKRNRADLADLQKQIADKDRALRTMSDTYDELVQETDTLTEQLQKASDEAVLSQTRQARIESLESELRDLQHQVTRKDVDIQALKSELSEQPVEIRQAEGRVREYVRMTSNLQHQLVEVEASRDAYKQQLSDAVEQNQRLEANLRQYAARVSTIQDEIERIETEKQELLQSYLSLSDEKSRLDESVQSYQQQSVFASSTAQQAQQRQRELETELSRINEDRTHLQAQKQQLQVAGEEALAENGRLQRDLRDRNEENLRMGQELENLAKVLAQLHERHGDLRSEINQIGSENEELQKRLTEAELIKRETEGRLDDVSQDTKRMEQLVAQEREKRAESSLALQEAEARERATARRLDDLERVVQQYRAELDEMRQRGRSNIDAMEELNKKLVDAEYNKEANVNDLRAAKRRIRDLLQIIENQKEIIAHYEMQT
eukprot:Clim_evm19s5 gene=Clim_evmTU19s5